MRSVFDPAARAALAARMERIPPDRVPLWGRMTAPRMLCHVNDSLSAALGELPVTSKGKAMFRNPVVRWLLIHAVPWPKGKTQTAPEMLTTQPSEWAADLAAFRDLLERAGTRDPASKWPEHPLFGDLSGRGWGALIHRHLDHHLRQFGV